MKKINFVLLLFCLLFSGCASTNSNYTDDVLFKSMKTYGYCDYKKIGILSILNSSNFEELCVDPDIELHFAEQLCSKCSNILLIGSDSHDCPDFLIFPPRNSFGGLDYSELVKLGRNTGFSAIVFQNIRNIDLYKRNSGFFWFKERKSFLRARVTVTVLDMLTGSILFRCDTTVESDELFDECIDPVEECTELVAKHLGKMLFESSDKLGSFAGIALSDQQWFTTILSVNGDSVALLSGDFVVGDRFAVFTTNTIQNSISDYVYFVPGPKIGEIEIVNSSRSGDCTDGVFIGSEVPKIGDIAVPIR